VLAVSLGSEESVAPAACSSPRPSETTRRRERAAADAVLMAPVVELARQGDGEAFGRLYDHYHASVFRVIYSQTRSRALAEDLTADTFFRALRGIERYKLEPELFQAWLFRIARNRVVDHAKARPTRLEQAHDMSLHEGLADDADTELIALLERERVRAGLAGLPASQRRVIELRFLGELSISEVADLLDTTEGAVKQLQYRGLRNLARLMRE
jgi:RNA polymerase sigma-70 factor (ECF subfamily)